MNSRERMAVAMQVQKPDRVPVMCQLALGHYFLNSGYEPHGIWFDSETFAKALVMLQRRYRFDGILVNIPAARRIFDQGDSIERTPDGEQMTWRNGEVTFCPWDDNPYHMDGRGESHAVVDFACFDPDHLEALDALTGYTWGVYHVPSLSGRTDRGPLREIPPYFLRAIDLVRRKADADVPIHGEVFSPFTHLLELFGYESARCSHAGRPGQDPRAAGSPDGIEHRLGGRAGAPRRGRRAHLFGLRRRPIPVAAACTRGSSLPYERRVTDAIKAAGVPVYTHTCGRIGDRLDLMVETGTEGIDTMDPPPLGNTELADAKAQVGGRVFLKGNMDSVVLLRAKTAEEVIAHAAGRIEIGMPGGGYILSTACSVAPRVEPWKLELSRRSPKRSGVTHEVGNDGTRTGA